MADRLTVGVVARLSRYLQVLTQAKKMGKDRISSLEISGYTNINATQIRRDLSAFGKFGRRGVGYNVDSLLTEIRTILRTHRGFQFEEAVEGLDRLSQAAAFLALLEMIKRGEVVPEQLRLFAPIRVVAAAGAAAEADVDADRAIA